MNIHTLVGRAVAQLDYNLYLAVVRQAEAMLKDPIHIPAIKAACEQFGYDDYMRNVFTNACIYEAYCPGAFFTKSISKMKVGFRDEACRVMGYNSPEMCNYFVDKARPFMKFRDKSFGKNVAAVMEQFKQYSVIKEDWQLELV